MNGWIRLWVFVSLIWMTATGLFAWYSIPQNYTVGPWTKFGLSDSSIVFFTHEFMPYYEPHYTVDLEFEDGTKEPIILPVLTADEVSPEYWREQIKEIADYKGKSASVFQPYVFSEKVAKKNEAAKIAKNQFDKLVSDKTAQSQESRSRHLTVSLLGILLPPLIALILGFGIAWVRRGFSATK